MLAQPFLLGTVISCKIKLAMENLLEKLTKEDLIKVIGNMTDTVQSVYDWKGNGMLEHDAEIVVKIGNACKEYCNKNDWALPII
jgi:uncharacterized protein involved in tolerance to divalent cations